MVRASVACSCVTQPEQVAAEFGHGLTELLEYWYELRAR